VRRLTAEGVPFKAFVRRAEQGRELGCPYVVGDFDDPGSLVNAFEGVDRLFLNHTEIAAKLSVAFSRPVRYVDLPPEKFAAKLAAQGVPAGFAADVAALYAEVAGGALAGTTTTVENLTGRAPRTFDQFLADYRAA
jgi:uncharacterized protein YbjT (DUF2867 family)